MLIISRASKKFMRPGVFRVPLFMLTWSLSLSNIGEAKLLLRFGKKSLCNFSIVNSLIFKNCIKYRQSSGKFSLK